MSGMHTLHTGSTGVSCSSSMASDQRRELQMLEDRVRIVDLFATGGPTGGRNPFSGIFNQLKWRQKYQAAEIYELQLSTGAELKVKQILNGEIKGLGTGTQVWPAAHVLVKFLELRYRSSGGMRGKKVCDIGTGTGVTGFAAADLGADVTLTDQEHLLDFLEENRALAVREGLVSAAAARIQRYDWGENASELPGPFDYVLVSDCVLPKLYPIDILVKAVSDVMAPHTIAYFSYEHRTYPYFDAREEFRAQAAAHGLHVTHVPSCEHDPVYRAEDIEIWEVRRLSA